jgi:hypothetical protein
VPDTWITDLRHFIDSDGVLVEGPAGRLAAYWCRLVEAGTVRPEGLWAQSAIRCRRHPGRARCPGHIRVRRSDGSDRVEWECPACTDRGVISGWEQSPWDLRAAQDDKHDTPIELWLSDEEYAVLGECEVVSIEAPLLLARAAFQRGKILLAGTESQLDDLLGHLAAEANHTSSRPRRKALDALYERIKDTLARRATPRDPLAESGDVAAISRDHVVEGIARVLGLTPELRERYAHVLVEVAGDALLDLRLRQRIDEALAGDPVLTRRLPAVVLELEDVLARIRSTGETRPEAACGTLNHLLDAVRKRLAVFPDDEMLRAFYARLSEVTVIAASRSRGSKGQTALARLVDAYLDDRPNRWSPLPALPAQTRLGKLLRRWLAAEVALRSDTAAPDRAERLAMLAAALAAGGR